MTSPFKNLKCVLFHNIPVCHGLSTTCASNGSSCNACVPYGDFPLCFLGIRALGGFFNAVGNPYDDESAESFQTRVSNLIKDL